METCVTLTTARAGCIQLTEVSVLRRFPRRFGREWQLLETRSQTRMPRPRLKLLRKAVLQFQFWREDEDEDSFCRKQAQRQSATNTSAHVRSFVCIIARAQRPMVMNTFRCVQWLFPFSQWLNKKCVLPRIELSVMSGEDALSPLIKTGQGVE